MRKLTLQLDDLRIDSFDTTPARRERGTVVGEQCTCPIETCGGYTCEGTYVGEATCEEGFTCLYLFSCDRTGCNQTCNVCGSINTPAGPGGCAYCP